LSRYHFDTQMTATEFILVSVDLNSKRRISWALIEDLLKLTTEYRINKLEATTSNDKEKLETIEQEYREQLMKAMEYREDIMNDQISVLQMQLDQQHQQTRNLISSILDGASKEKQLQQE